MPSPAGLRADTGPDLISGIVVAAGVGRRFGTRKHEARLAGRALWEWARDALLESGACEVVVVGPVPGGIEGGTERHDSVACGLAAIDPAATIVAVHDAARPLASAAMMERMYEALGRSGSDGVVPVVPIPDALKRLDGNHGRILRSVSREAVVAAQTPQVFRASALRRAHAAHAKQGSSGPVADDASMVEAIGGRVVTVAGERRAMKITYPEDLAVAEALLREKPAPRLG